MPSTQKNLAYRLFTIAERKGWAGEAYAYNALVIAWPEIQSKAAEIQAIKPEQLTLFDTGRSKSWQKITHLSRRASVSCTRCFPGT
jgi:hypothetical protein